MEEEEARYNSGKYWVSREDYIYYKYYELMVRCIAPEAKSIIDVGSGNSPYIEWFDWIPKKVSIDIRAPYSSETVEGIVGSILDVSFPEKFDVCTCLQVLEHVKDAGPFARRLLEMSDTVLVSVPYMWPEGSVKSHVHDPVDLDKVNTWFKREPNYSLVVQEPFRGKKGQRLFAIYNADVKKKYGGDAFRNRRRLDSQ